MNGWFSTNERRSTVRIEPRAEHRPIPGELVRHGDYWTVLFDEREIRIRDAKGMRYLAELLSRPGTELTAVELQAAGSPGPRSSARVSADARLAVEADLGPALDSRAKDQYRTRLADLEAEREEAESFHDPERAAQARAEYEQLASELAAALGRGRRDRRVGSPEERARVNVTRAIKTSIGRLARHNRLLGEHLAATVVTGRVCVYRPERSRRMQWRVLTRESPANGMRPFAPPETQYAQADGASVAYQVLGEGETDIVFVPGVISHLDLLWEDDVTASFFRRLATLGRLILFDKRDTGLSDSAQGDGTLEERMDDMLAVMSACSCHSAVLFGFSEGGPMSIMFAASYPERVRALILGAAAARWTSAPDYPCGRQSDETIDTLEQIAKHRWGTGDTIDVYLPGLAHSIHARRLLARYERMSASPSAFLRMLRLIRQIDVRSLLPAIHAPRSSSSAWTTVLHRDTTANTWRNTSPTAATSSSPAITPSDSPAAAIPTHYSRRSTTSSPPSDSHPIRTACSQRSSSHARVHTLRNRSRATAKHHGQRSGASSTPTVAASSKARATSPSRPSTARDERFAAQQHSATVQAT